jgi:hypothetical protein
VVGSHYLILFLSAQRFFSDQRLLLRPNFPLASSQSDETSWRGGGQPDAETAGMKGERKACLYCRNEWLTLTLASNSGIFGYVNYLVEKDRKFIIDTLINGT